MKYIFIGYYINALFRWKLKGLRIFIALIMLAVPFLKYKGIINFVLGKIVNEIEIVAVGGSIYLLINLIYVLLSNKPVETKTEEKPKAPIKEPVKAPLDIIKKVDYKSSTVKISPKKESLSEAVKPNQATFVEPKSLINEAPPLDLNLEVNVEFFEQEKKELEQKYSGMIDENYVHDITDVEIIETALPDPETALYEKVKRKLF